MINNYIIITIINRWLGDCGAAGVKAFLMRFHYFCLQFDI